VKEFRASRLGLSSDGRWLLGFASAQSGLRLQVWDLTLADPAAAPAAVLGPQQGAQFGTPSGTGAFVPSDPRLGWLSWVVATTDNGDSRLWDFESTDPLASARVLPASIKPANVLTVSHDRRWLFERDQTLSVVLVWDLSATERTTPVLALRGQSGSIQSAAVTPDDHWLATSSDKQIRVWDLTAPNPEASAIEIPEDAARNGLAISPDGRWVVNDLHAWRLDLQELRAIACQTVGRNLTQDEWIALQGRDTPYATTCAN
jgi:WD domain, G-beta repeat